MEQAHQRWQVTRGRRLFWKVWDDEFVFYDVASGDTHLIDIVSGEALKNLINSPASAGELSAKIESAFELAGDTNLSTHLANLLTKLQELGLIEPAHP